MQFMQNNAKNIRHAARPPVSARVEALIACTGSPSTVRLMRDDVKSTGAVQYAIVDLSTKVLYERLRTLWRLGIVNQQNFDEVPPRMQYRLIRSAKSVLPRGFTASIDCRLGSTPMLRRSMDGHETATNARC